MCTLDEKTVKLIQDTAVKAHGNRILKAEDEPLGTYYTVGQDGALTRVQATAYPITADLYSLDAVIAFAKHHENFSEGGTQVYYGAGQVTVVLDPDRRKDHGAFHLQTSEEFDKLKSLSGPMKQADFVGLLRTTFADALDAHAQLLPAIRKLRAVTASDTEADMQHGKETMSRRVMAEVQGTSDIPDVLTLSVPIYRNAGEAQRYPIRCALTIDPTNVTFTLKPIAGELDRAVQAHEAGIRERLIEGLNEGTPVFYGQA